MASKPSDASIEGESLGAAGPWQIRAIPFGVRDMVIDQAHAERISVGQLLTRMVLAMRDAGWPRSVDASTYASAGANASADASNPARLQAAVAMVESIARSGGKPPQKRIMASAQRLLAVELRALEGPTRRLSPPSKGDDLSDPAQE